MIKQTLYLDKLALEELFRFFAFISQLLLFARAFLIARMVIMAAYKICSDSQTVCENFRTR